ncbi:MAG: NADH-quinone oxidoreductase subunit NuoE [Legionellales bacterium]|nr:NADH-quinone oxidoreductase subunit NuoE [Legionellales bacterium]|tara:strand:+ start:741 stop:1235 length:495 start_codon:yes stop_codon:yes gene_type:complete
MTKNYIELLTDASQKNIDEWLARYPYEKRRSALLPALHVAQDQNGGYLTDNLLQAVADYIDVPKIYAYEAATFYSMFELKPVGRNKVYVCNSVCCMLRGSDDIIEQLKAKLNINLGETTPDGKITLKEVECLAACGGAPAMMVNKTYHENLTSEKIDEILQGLE